MFIQLLYYKFASNQSDVMTRDSANIKVSILSQKEDEDFHIYHYWTKTLLMRISVRDQVIYNRENMIT